MADTDNNVTDKQQKEKEAAKRLKEMQAEHMKFREEHGTKIVTASKIKEYCQALGHRCAGDLADEVADVVYKALWKAIVRCDGNNRMTVMRVDL